MAAPPTLRTRRAAKEVPVALGAFVLVQLSLQMFLLTVGVDAFLADDDKLAWVSAGFSVLLGASSVAFYRFMR
ncbi:MAG: hypothetical protein ABIP03_05935 [Aquihabitans sp.]